MPTFKHVWNFKASNGGTWSETWYREATAISSEIVLGTPLYLARLALLHPTNQFVSDSISQTNNPRVATVAFKGGFGTDPGYNAGIPTNTPAAVSWSAVINCAGVTGGSKRWELRGWSDLDFFRGATTGIDRAADGAANALQTLLNQLNTNNFGLRVLQASTPALNPYLPISKIDGSRGDGTTDITTSVAAGFAAPARIIIGLTSKKDTPNLNGHFTALKIAPVAAPGVGTVFTIQYRTPANGVVANPQGRVRQEIYNPTSVISAGQSGFFRVASRTTRGGTRTSRGAKRAARIRGLA